MTLNKRTAAVAGLAAVLLLAGCTKGKPPPEPLGPKVPAGDVTTVGGGTAVVILVDTSGSMQDPVKDHDGKMRPKHELARAALDRIMERTGEWRKGHPDKMMKVGLAHFSGSVADVLPLGDFDLARAQQAVKRIPPPRGDTAIGTALKHAYRELVKAHAERLFILCITDGQNTHGPSPEHVARQIHDESGGKVEIHFIAFDVSAQHFAFLKDVGGRAVEAADAKQLQEALDTIYQKRIFAEGTEPPDF